MRLNASMSALGWLLPLLGWQISFLPPWGIHSPNLIPPQEAPLVFRRDFVALKSLCPKRTGSPPSTPAPRALPALPKGCSQLRHNSLRLAAGCCRSMRGAVGGLGFFQPLHLQVSLAWRREDKSTTLCPGYRSRSTARASPPFPLDP
jgi:hypothetical protein